MRRLGFGPVVATVVLGAQLLVLPQQVAATSLVVTTLTDAVAADGQCSLREAIIASNSMAASNECPAGGASIDNVTFAVEGTITLGSNLPHVTKGIAIHGEGITIDGALSYQPFYVETGELTLYDLTITHGFSTYGGAVANGGHASLVRVTMRANSASVGGGAAHNGPGATLYLWASTIDGNTAQTGGGIFSEGTFDATNSTIAGNTADDGGGVYSSGGATFYHSTITGNSAATGAGVDVAAGTTVVHNSLIVNNPGPETAGSLTNLFSIIQGSSTGILDPRGLRDNGGPTRTVALVSGNNPALAFGDHDGCISSSFTDQRGLSRPSGAGDKCDAGAVQRDRVAPTVTSGPSTKLRSYVALSGTSSRAAVTWGAADNAGGSGIDHYTVARSVNGGSWTTVSSSVRSKSLNVTLTNGKTYRFRVRAVDHDGNTSAWRYGPTFRDRLVQQTSSSVVFSSGWSSRSSTLFSGGSVKYTRLAGKSVKITFTGRSIALVTTLRSTTAPGFKVYVDGVYKGVFGLLSSTTLYRAQGMVWNFAGSRTHTIRLVTVDPVRLDVDGFAILR